MIVVPVNGNVQSPKSTIRVQQWLLWKQGCRSAVRGVGLGLGGGGGGPCTPAGPGALDENESVGTEDFKGLVSVQTKEQELRAA